MARLVDGDGSGPGTGLGGVRIAAREARHRVAVDHTSVNADVVVIVPGHGAREVALTPKRRRQVREEIQVQGVVTAAPCRVQVGHVRVIVPDRAALLVKALADHVVD